MKYIRLGKSELLVSRVGFGGIPITRLSYEPLAKPSETQQDSPVTDLSESFTIHALT